MAWNLKQSYIFWFYFFIPAIVFVVFTELTVDFLWMKLGHISLVSVIYYIIEIPWLLVSSVMMFNHMKNVEFNLENYIYLILFICMALLLLIYPAFISFAIMAI